MRIISTTPDSNGAYPPIQDWPGHKAPAGFAQWPDSLETATFDQYKGFIVPTIVRGRVASYTANVEAYEAYPPRSRSRPAAAETPYTTSWRQPYGRGLIRYEQ